MGPTEYPGAIKDTTQIGSLFTLLLHAPLKAFAFISDITQCSGDSWSGLVSAMTALEGCVVGVLNEHAAVLDKSYRRFLQDDFLRQFVVRFIIGHVLLCSHTAFSEAKVCVRVRACLYSLFSISRLRIPRSTRMC